VALEAKSRDVQSQKQFMLSCFKGRSRRIMVLNKFLLTSKTRCFLVWCAQNTVTRLLRVVS